jgi:hypothetical protein
VNHPLLGSHSVLLTIDFLDCAISVRTPALDSFGVDARRIFRCELAKSALFPTVKVDVLDVEGVYVTWDVTEDGETDIDQQIGAAARDHEYANGREKDGDDDDKEGRRCVRHCALLVVSRWERQGYDEIRVRVDVRVSKLGE